MLYTGPLDDQLGHSILTAGAVTVAALVVLAGRLPSNAKPRGDLRPPDTHADRLVHQHREFGICLLAGESGSFDPLQYLGWRQLGIPLRWAWQFRSFLGPLPGLHVPDLRPALGPAHVAQHAGRV
jgi:hypothetical protein